MMKSGKSEAPIYARSGTERLRAAVEAELARQSLAGEEAAKEVPLPSNAFRSLLRKGHRPSIDRADELCRALGITRTIGRDPPITIES